MRARLRALHVGDREFTWRAEIHHHPRLIRVRVWGAGKNGRALQADLRPHGDPPAYPSADVVRALVAYGLEAGWDPAATGGTFAVPASAPITIPDLTVVNP
jgi:hypothetical protein